MSSSDVAESQEAIIKTLKEGGAQLNGDVHTHTNGHSSNGVDSVDGGAGSKPAAPTTPEEASTPKSEDAPVVTNEEAPTPKNELEHTSKSEEAPTPKNEVEHTSKGEEAPTHRSEDAPVVKNEEEPTPKNDVEHSSKSEEAPTHRSEDAPVVTNETPKSDDDVPSLRVEPATPNSEDGLSLKGEDAAAPKNEEAAPAPEKASEANHKPEDRGAPAPAPAAASRSPKKEWFTKRQSSQEMKKEVEVQSRPTISKASMSTSVDEKSVRAAYEDVRADTTDTEWAVFKFQDQNVVCSATGVGFDSFRSNFKEDDRAFGFIRIQMGDEMSKRQKFVFITWVGPDVSVIRRAKMSIDKAMVKNIVKTFAVELQLESLGDINVEYFREQLARAGGANYGTGVRA